ncbi:flagellar filament capping protein FliD [Paenibacillus lentus]|uniref:flagellar filament capping protein FliD n=1 Tax=Paenibacillus lentus TaxID=1338368 RepID=UPI003654D4EB
MGVSLTGLASGLNTAEIISNLMKLERIPYDNLETKKTKMTDNKNTFNNINLKLKALRDAATNLSDVDAFRSNSAVSSDSTKLSAVAGSNALNGSYSVEVVQLAKRQVNATAAIQMKQADGEDKLFSNSDLLAAKSIKVNGVSLNLDDLELEGKSFENALVEISNQINKQFGEEVQASLVQTAEGQKSLVVTAKETGKTVDLEGTGIFELQSKVTAQVAKIKVNGIDVESSSNTVSDAIPGVTLNLLAEESTVNIEVKQDVDKIAEKVEKFVNAFNDVVKLIRENTKKITNEKNPDGSYKNFKTNLQGDSMLKSLQSELYNIINAVEGATGNDKLFLIGLEIDKGATTAAMMTGELDFDKELFKEKLIADPGIVEELIKGDNGLGTIAKDRLHDWTRTNGLLASRMEGYDSEINYITEQMDSMEQRLILKEEAMKKKYVQMEVALSKLQSQQNWMAGQLNALTASNKS